jgi:hypothetical protein
LDNRPENGFPFTVSDVMQIERRIYPLFVVNPFHLKIWLLIRIKHDKSIWWMPWH